jgi:hypothetical protein
MADKIDAQIFKAVEIKPAHQGSFSPDQARSSGSDQSAEDNPLTSLLAAHEVVAG